MAPLTSPLQSMTGFGAAEGGQGSDLWRWELKSVNGRGLDLRCRLASGFEKLEPEVRQHAAKRLKRGNVSISLTLDRSRRDAEVRINQTVLDQVIAAAAEISTRMETAPPGADGLLGLRGVMELVEPEADEDTAEALKAHILAGFETALDDLVGARAREGTALGGILAGLIDRIESLTKEAEALAEAQADALKEKLRTQIAELAAEMVEIDPDRLHQEVAILLTKADIREELDRLTAHVAAAREHLAADGAVGRKLDFLTQEFNREANTLCSKSSSNELTATGLEMKAVVDQLREQVQNVE